MMSDAALPVAPVGVWVQLLVGEERQGQNFEIKPIPENVHALKKAVKEEWTVSLHHCDTDMLDVFAPGADPKTETALKANALVPSDATYDNPLIVVAPKHHQQPQQDAGDEMERFLTLLRSRMISPDKQVLSQVIRHFAASVPLIRDAELAADIYYTASRIPRTATEIMLHSKGISVAQPFQASDPGRAVLLHAFRDGYPMILKVSTPASTRNEVKVMNALKEHGVNDNSHLVLIEEVKFESGSIECAAALSGNHANTRSGLLMKLFQTTLAQCKISLPENVLLHYGRQIEIAIKFLHSAGICHLDIKPSNIFLFEPNCYLGDYGAAKQVGEEIHEISRNYYPSDLPIVAETKTDFLLLAKTMLELFGEIDSPVKPMSTDEILEAVHKVKNERVRSFLESLLE